MFGSFHVCLDRRNFEIAGAFRANQFFKLDGLVEMVTRRVSEDFNGFLANASGYQNTQFQKLICPGLYGKLRV